VKWENVLFDYAIHRHFRFPSEAAGSTESEEPVED
jgi:hypothetical protein